ncbi:hypothetical protein GDO78_019412 [Eleutherodactylus coqui]|uniref:DDB1- and CUL4-associated factor 15 WD40 repeat-containing domain-containing protein n=1 Tax=Eleutherodactylus coqui TaxID=57060 RepID=A0A8J6EPD9_ELECQ|nr:hypothetical protein GDO78_019412 [Eleutherodactylus coqui]
MAPSSKSDRGSGSRKWGPRDHIIRQLNRAKITGQLASRLFRKLPPRLCVSLRSIVDEEFLKKGHVFLGFTKCGRFVLSYTNDVLDDDFSFYSYRLYWWEFQVHNKLRLVQQVRLFKEEEIYSDLYLTICEWPGDSSKLIVFGFNTSVSGMLMNMITDDNHRDIYVSTVSSPPVTPCTDCRESPQGSCLLHNFMLYTKYQVVYPFPTFQPAFQLKKDHVVLLNTSFTLVACAVSVHPGGDTECRRVLYSRQSEHFARASSRSTSAPSSSSNSPPSSECCSPTRPGTPPSVTRAREFMAGLLRRAREGSGVEAEDRGERPGPSRPSVVLHCDSETSWPRPNNAAYMKANNHPDEPSYINYTQLRYVLGQGPHTMRESELEDDKISLPFVVTDLKGQRLKVLNNKAVFKGQQLVVEQLTLDFEYVINEVIRHDASWSHQFCAFNDYDIVILETCPETNQVVMNIGLLLLAMPDPPDGFCRWVTLSRLCLVLYLRSLAQTCPRYLLGPSLITQA